MEGTFAAILGRQEREDAAAAHSEAALRQAVCREFVNGKALLAAADFCMTDFFAAERTALPAVPIRTAAKFSIKKHTASQRPYRHGHDFYELICVHGGCCRQRIGDAPLLLAQGQCCLLAPGAEHEIERCGGRQLRREPAALRLPAGTGGRAAAAAGDRLRFPLYRPGGVGRFLTKSKQRGPDRKRVSHHICCVKALGNMSLYYLRALPCICGNLPACDCCAP